MRRKKRSILEQLEYKFGRFAIENISLYLIICYGFGYVMQLINSDFLMYLTLNPERILHGQIWRIFTWVIVPPYTTNVFFLLITMYFYYSIGTSLERTWGVFRYNLYLFSGMFFTVLGSLLLYVVFHLGFGGEEFVLYATYANEEFFSYVSQYFSTYYINMSIFLAYAATFQDRSVYFMMLFPIKVKWLGIIYGCMLLADFFQGSLVTKFSIGASLLNFLIFFLLGRGKVRITPAQKKRRKEYKREVVQSQSVTKHKCAVCGRTELDGEHLEFRFCSRCNGNYEYCQDHIFTHEHVTK
ncbi:MAG: hypothetical protein R3Y67_07890 [Eubacteriales bacterium]